MLLRMACCYVVVRAPLHETWLSTGEAEPPGEQTNGSQEKVFDWSTFVGQKYHKTAATRNHSVKNPSETQIIIFHSVLPLGVLAI